MPGPDGQAMMSLSSRIAVLDNGAKILWGVSLGLKQSQVTTLVGSNGTVARYTR